MKIEVSVSKLINSKPTKWTVMVTIRDYAACEWVERAVDITSEVEFVQSSAYREMLAEAMSKAIHDIWAEDMGMLAS